MIDKPATVLNLEPPVAVRNLRRPFVEAEYTSVSLAQSSDPRCVWSTDKWIEWLLARVVGKHR